MVANTLEEQVIISLEQHYQDLRDGNFCINLKQSIYLELQLNIAVKLI